MLHVLIVLLFVLHPTVHAKSQLLFPPGRKKPLHPSFGYCDPRTATHIMHTVHSMHTCISILNIPGLGHRADRRERGLQLPRYCRGDEHPHYHSYYRYFCAGRRSRGHCHCHCHPPPAAFQSLVPSSPCRHRRRHCRGAGGSDADGRDRTSQSVG